MVVVAVVAAVAVEQEDQYSHLHTEAPDLVVPPLQQRRSVYLLVRETQRLLNREIQQIVWLSCPARVHLQ